MYRFLSGRLKQLGINQGDLAHRWGLSQASVSARFTGKVDWSIREMYDLLHICRAQPDELHLYFPDPEKEERCTA